MSASTDSLAKETSKLALSAKRRPYLGSCHCQKIRYVLWLTLPMQPPYDSRPGTSSQLVRKCNCTVCHKFGFFHLRVSDSPRDFVLLSPLDPLNELSDYLANDHGMHWLFCPTCGVRCFAIEGSGEVVERDLAADGVDLKRAKVEGDGKTVKVWSPKAEGWNEEKTNWLRVNALTLDAKQEGLDLKEWHEKKMIEYVNWLDETPGRSYECPYESGAY